MSGGGRASSTRMDPLRGQGKSDSERRRGEKVFKIQPPWKRSSRDACLCSRILLTGRGDGMDPIDQLDPRNLSGLVHQRPGRVRPVETPRCRYPCTTCASGYKAVAGRGDQWPNGFRILRSGTTHFILNCSQPQWASPFGGCGRSGSAAAYGPCSSTRAGGAAAILRFWSAEVGLWVVPLVLQELFTPPPSWPRWASALLDQYRDHKHKSCSFLLWHSLHSLG
jgi:hypothetical protein